MSNPTDPAFPALSPEAVGAIERIVRRHRIMERVQRGWTPQLIAEAEGLKPRRVREIIQETLARQAADPAGDHVRLQVARLDNALRLAGERVADGELVAIDRLLRVLRLLDRYREAAPATPPPPAFDEEADAAAPSEADADALVERAAEDEAQAAARRAPEAGGPSALAGFGWPATR
jgi:hypothetical protein